MKKTPSKVAHNRPQIFFVSIANWSKTSPNLYFCSKKLLTACLMYNDFACITTEFAMSSHKVSISKGIVITYHISISWWSQHATLFWNTPLKGKKIMRKTFQQLQIKSVQFGRVNAIKDWKVFWKIPRANAISNEKTMKMVTNLFSRLILTE